MYNLVMDVAKKDRCMYVYKDVHINHKGKDERSNWGE